MKKWMTDPPYYAELGHAIPSGLDISLEEKVKTCVKNAIKALGVDFGSVNMDLLITDTGKIHIIDVGARMGGNLIGSHIIPLGTGIDYMGNIIKASVYDELDFMQKSCQVVVTRVLALTPGTVRALPDFDVIKNEFKVQIEQHLHVGDEITPYQTNLDGCGYVIACGYDYENVMTRAENARRKIDELIKRVE